MINDAHKFGSSLLSGANGTFAYCRDGKVTSGQILEAKVETEPGAATLGFKTTLKFRVKKMRRKRMNKTLFDYQAKLLYSMVVAGKSANFADKAMRAFMYHVAALTQDHRKGKITELPFAMLKKLTAEDVMVCLRNARTGNYTKLAKGIAELLKADIELATCKPEQLEAIHGIGPKTSRFFIMWCRPQEKYAALDVHVLRWLGKLGHKVPRSTPQNPKLYAKLETIFLEEAAKRGKTPRELDKEIWEAGAARTQETPLPEPKK